MDLSGPHPVIANRRYILVMALLILSLASNPQFQFQYVPMSDFSETQF